MSDFNTLLAARDLMTSDIVTSSRTITVKEAAGIMADREVSSIVLTEENGAIAGIVTETDIVRKAVAEGADAARAGAASIMSENVHSIPGDASIFDARAKMSDLGVKHMIVEDGGKPIGIISSTALLGS
ncbi:MAG: CBS domain-containing protein [Candidatus Nitrospinota bacterium M3_3B_026]